MNGRPSDPPAKVQEPGSGEQERPAGRILVAEDDPTVARMLSRVLTPLGHELVLTADGAAAREQFNRGGFDLVLSDLSMPELDGLGLLAAVRSVDMEVPFILVTATPSTDTAVHALNLRATSYLAKPLAPKQLCEEVDKALKLGRMADVRRQARALSVRPPSAVLAADDHSGLAARFDNALQELHMAYQPIVSWSRRAVFGFEGLVRTREKSIPHPGALFDAAEQLERLQDLSRRIREVVGGPVVEQAVTKSLFVNLHTRDLLDEELYSSETPLAKLAEQVVFEITERANLNAVPDLDVRVARLRELGYRLAVDDIGAGYSGLNSFAMLRPDFVKLDLSLVRDIDKDPLKQRLVRMLCELSEDLSISVVGEGVETVAERETLLGLGCDLLQGYLLARPGAPFPVPEYGE